MKKIKRLLAFTACAAACCLLSGCLAVPVQTPPAAGTEHLTMLIPDRAFPLGVSTQDGYYYVEPGTTNSLTGMIRYVDYASAVDLPLSTQVNSSHTDDSDTAYLDSIIGDYRMLLFHDHLYFIRSGSSGSGESDALSAAAVYRMNLDGSDRMQIYQSTGGGTLMMYAVGGESCLYLLEQTPDAVEVLQLPEAGGDAKSLASLPGNNYYKLIGCRDGLFYFHVIGYDPDKINSAGDMGSTTHTLATLDPSTGTLNNLADLCPDDNQYAEPYMAGTTLLYYYPNGEHTVAFCDGLGQVESTLSLADAAGGAFQQTDNPYVVGDVLFIPCWDASQGHGYQILVDTETKCISRSDICLTQQDGKDSLGATVLAETGTCYLAMTEIRYENAEVPLGDGTTTTLQNQIYGYSLIPKDQFTAQSPTLQTVNRM